MILESFLRVAFVEYFPPWNSIGRIPGESEAAHASWNADSFRTELHGIG